MSRKAWEGRVGSGGGVERAGGQSVAPVKRPGKYRNVRSGGFDSKKEAARYQELLLLERAGQIRNLRRQTRWELIPKQEGERAVSWVADFVYNENGEEVWEDCKGYRTPLYILKRKLVLWVYGKKIRET